MPDLWVLAAAAPALALASGLYLLTRRRRHAPVTPAVPGDDREARLARRVAGAVGCTPTQALPAVRREIGLGPNQSDETLIKRAVYHYRQELPEKACGVYRDRAAG